MAKQRWFVICLLLFAVAACVRILVWQNNKVAMAGVQYVVTEGYVHDAELLLNRQIGTFVRGIDPPSNANILIHPPGYPIFLAAIEGVFGAASPQVVQILVNSLAPVLLFLIGAYLFGNSIGCIVGVFGVFSPQFAYHSGIILPDELSVLPILVAVLAFVWAYEKPDIRWAILCGFSIGLSCWLRANALVLPVFFAAAAMALIPRSVRLHFVGAMLTAFIITIAPITLRNYIVFESFIPLSLGTGTTFIEGLADIDPAGTRGMPKTDEDVMAMDADRLKRPEYFGTLYSPDGVLRERKRIAWGLSAVGSDPLWFIGGAASRGINAVRLERVPVIEPTYDEKESTEPLLYGLNIPLKVFQRAFITAVFLPLVILGLLLLLKNRDSRGKLLLLSIVPLYYMSVQPLIHTEYRYVLPGAHVLMIFAGVGVGYLGELMFGRFRVRSNGNGIAGA
jgi:4-amino-4-deoxy-L-arabinose transferase-like glycosyltransferase